MEENTRHEGEIDKLNKCGCKQKWIVDEYIIKLINNLINIYIKNKWIHK